MDRLSELPEHELLRKAERGRQILGLVGGAYFGLNALFVLVALALFGPAVLLSLVKITGAAILFTLVYHGYNWARVLLVCWATLAGGLVLLLIALHPPGSLSARVFLNGLALLWFGVGALFLSSKSIQAHQLIKRREWSSRT